MTTALGTAADWYVSQLAEHGLFAVLAVQAVIVIALSCTAGFAFHLYERRLTEADTVRQAADGIRTLENYANHESVRIACDTDLPPRKEKP